MGQKLKVRVEMTLVVDADDWTTAFGVEGERRIRQDVQDYLCDGVNGLRVWEEVSMRVTRWCGARY